MFALRDSAPTKQIDSVDRKALCCIAALVILAIVFYSKGEKIQAGNGLGWAGSEYAYSIMTFPESLANISEYHIHRAFIPVAFGFFFKYFNVLTTPANITSAFIFLNSLSLLGIAYLLTRISVLLKFSTRQTCLCFFGCLANYAFTKFPSFYPILPDWFATFVSLLLFYLWLKNKLFILFILSIVGNFIHPMLSLLGMILLAFPFRTATLVNINFAETVSNVFVLMVTALVALESYRVLTGALSSPFSTSQTSLYAGSLTTSIILIVIYVVSKQVYIEKVRHRPTNSSTYQTAIKIAIALASFFVSTLLTKATSSSESHLSIISFLDNSFTFGSLRPLSFIASHFLYFGPAYLIFLISYKQVLGSCLDHLGDAALPLLLLFTTFGVDSESRHIMIFWPIICIISVLSLKQYLESFSAFLRFYFVALAILLSQIWFPSDIFKDISGPYSEFPAQWYFMYHGPWMNSNIHAVLIMLLGITCVVLKLSQKASILHNDNGSA